MIDIYQRGIYQLPIFTKKIDLIILYKIQLKENVKVRFNPYSIDSQCSSKR